jgi:hypothetical protein
VRGVSLLLLSEFQATLVFMLVSTVILLLGCVFRMCLRVRAAQRAAAAGLSLDTDEGMLEDDDETSRNSVSRAAQAAAEAVGKAAKTKALLKLVMKTAPWTDFKQRVQNAVLILLTVFYLRLTTLMFKAFKCATAPGPLTSTESDAPVHELLMLVEDMQTVCYEGAHLATMAGVIILLIVYTAGLPIAFFILLTRAFATSKTGGFVGYMRSKIKLLQGAKKRRRQSMWAAARGSGIAHMGPDGTAPATGLATINGPASPSQANAAAASGHHAGALSVDIAHSTPVHTGSINVASDGPIKFDGGADANEPTAAQLQLYRENKFGFLFVGYRDEYFHASVLLLFVVNMYFSAVTVFADGSPIMQLFLFGLMWSLVAAGTAIYIPFSSWLDNFKKVSIGLATLAHSTMLLAAQTDGTRSTQFFLLLGCFTFITLLLLCRQFFIKLPCMKNLPCLRWAKMPDAFRQAHKGGGKGKGVQPIGAEGDADGDDEEERADRRSRSHSLDSIGQQNDDEKSDDAVTHLRILAPPNAVEGEEEQEEGKQPVMEAKADELIVRVQLEEQRRALELQAAAEAEERSRQADAARANNETQRLMSEAADAIEAARAAATRAEHAVLELEAAGSRQTVAAQVREEEARLAREDAAVERTEAKDVCGLPPTMLQILAQRTSAGSDESAAAAALMPGEASASSNVGTPQSEADWFDCLREAHAVYEEQGANFLREHPAWEAEALIEQASDILHTSSSSSTVP